MVMKKAFLVLAILVGSAALTFAQPKSIGGRLGNYGIDVSYENYVFGGADFRQQAVEALTGDRLAAGPFEADGRQEVGQLRGDRADRAAEFFNALFADAQAVIEL